MSLAQCTVKHRLNIIMADDAITQDVPSPDKGKRGHKPHSASSSLLCNASGFFYGAQAKFFHRLACGSLNRLVKNSDGHDRFLSGASLHLTFVLV
jgi:hypothetical protein